MTTPDPIRAALERLMLVVEQDRRSQHDTMTLIAMNDPVGEALDDARAALAAVQSDGPAAGDVGEALAARPLLEQVAAIGDCISEQTVGRVRVLANQASAWLAEYPPGQPVTIEPRGCPMPGACSCVELPTPQPVAVSERLPGAEDCDAEGRCWLLTVEDDYPQWRLHTIEGAQPGGAMIWVPVDSSPGVMVDCFYTSHWLPAHALPLPATTPAGQEGA